MSALYTGKISLKKCGNTTYVEYTYGRRYMPEKKYNVPKRTTIGKIERPLFASDEKMRYFHLFYSSQRHASEQEILEARIDRMKKNLKKIYGKVKEIPKEYQHYFKPIYFHEGQEEQLLELAMEKSDVIEEKIHLCGYFCIIISKRMEAKDALELYKSWDESEKLFKGDKSYLGNKAVRVQSDESTEAKIFIEFVALVI